MSLNPQLLSVTTNTTKLIVRKIKMIRRKLKIMKMKKKEEAKSR